ncbi:MAG: hypothetical protein M3R10_05500 [Verrucomicrobiota bacterium]|nr:hypothetical protein [Verrucomicrobiota bacterium]
MKFKLTIAAILASGSIALVCAAAKVETCAEKYSGCSEACTNAQFACKARGTDPYNCEKAFKTCMHSCDKAKADCEKGTKK